MLQNNKSVFFLVKRRQLCVHLHFLAFARKLKENENEALEVMDEDVHVEGEGQNIEGGQEMEREDNQENVEVGGEKTGGGEQIARSRNDIIRTWEDELQGLSTSNANTLRLQMQRQIAYEIELDIVNNSTNLHYGTKCGVSGVPIFEPVHQKCNLCSSPLGKSVFPQGCSAAGGNGMLITHAQPFRGISIKIKKCKNKDCCAVNQIFPYDIGMNLMFMKSILNEIKKASLYDILSLLSLYATAINLAGVHCSNHLKIFFLGSYAHQTKR